MPIWRSVFEGNEVGKSRKNAEHIVLLSVVIIILCWHIGSILLMDRLLNISWNMMTLAVYICDAAGTCRRRIRGIMADLELDIALLVCEMRFAQMAAHLWFQSARRHGRLWDGFCQSSASTMMAVDKKWAVVVRRVTLANKGRRFIWCYVCRCAMPKHFDLL